VSIAVYIKAHNEKEGQPLRGWLILQAEGNQFIEDGITGIDACLLPPFTKVLATLNVSKSEYRRIRRECGV
jgi:hypothetical protein